MKEFHFMMDKFKQESNLKLIYEIDMLILNNVDKCEYGWEIMRIIIKFS